MSVVDIPRRGKPRYKDADPPQRVHLTVKVHSQCSSYCQGEIVSFLVCSLDFPVYQRKSLSVVLKTELISERILSVNTEIKATLCSNMGSIKKVAHWAKALHLLTVLILGFCHDATMNS